MGAIIKMDSKEFIKKFIKKEDYRKFNFLLISEDIKTIKEFKNVFAIPTLIPPANVVSVFINEGPSDKYIQKYVNYLRIPKVEALITVIVKLAVVENSNVILLCSKRESEYMYIDIICKYIKKVYGVKTYSYKKYAKNPNACETVGSKKKVIKVLEKKLSNIDSDMSPTIDVKEMKRRLQSLSKRELRAYCKQQSVDVKKDDSKDKMIKRLMKNFK